MRSEIGQGNLAALSTHLRQIQGSTTADARYQRALARFRRHAITPSPPKHTHCTNLLKASLLSMLACANLSEWFLFCWDASRRTGVRFGLTVPPLGCSSTASKIVPQRSRGSAHPDREGWRCLRVSKFHHGYSPRSRRCFLGIPPIEELPNISSLIFRTQ